MLVLCAALAVSALAATLDALRGLRYTAESLVLVQDLGETGADGVSGERLGEIRAAIGQEEVSRSAMDDIGWGEGIGEFDRGLEVETGGEGELSVAFSAETPERAAQGANAYAGAFVERAERLDGDRLAGGVLNAGTEVVREAQPPPSPAGLRPLAVGLLALFPGLAVGGALALALGGRDRHWRDARDAELTLGAPVLGVIPERAGGSPDPESEEDGVVRKP